MHSPLAGQVRELDQVAGRDRDATGDQRPLEQFGRRIWVWLEDIGLSRVALHGDFRP